MPNALTRSEEHTSELQSRPHLVCRLLLEKKKNNQIVQQTTEAEPASPTGPTRHTGAAPYPREDTARGYATRSSASQEPYRQRQRYPVRNGHPSRVTLRGAPHQ